MCPHVRADILQRLVHTLTLEAAKLVSEVNRQEFRRIILYLVF